MRKWGFKTVAAIVIWVAATLLIAFIASLLVTVGSTQIKALGTFLQNNDSLIGFLFGAWYFLWGPVPPQFN